MALDLISVSRSGLRGRVIGAVAGVGYGALVTGAYCVWMNMSRPHLLPEGAVVPMIALGILWGTPAGAILGTMVGAFVASVGERRAWASASVGMGLALLAWVGVFRVDAVQVMIDAPLLIGTWLVFSGFVGAMVSRTPPSDVTTSRLGIRGDRPAPN